MAGAQNTSGVGGNGRLASATVTWLGDTRGAPVGAVGWTSDDIRWTGMSRLSITVRQLVGVPGDLTLLLRQRNSFEPYMIVPVTGGGAIDLIQLNPIVGAELRLTLSFGGADNEFVVQVSGAP